MRNKIVQLDFDGTLVDFRWPKIGDENLRWKPVIKKLIAAGYEIRLNTYRADHIDGRPFQAAQDWLLERMPEYDFEANRSKIVPPAWDLSGKNDLIFIDDMADNMPLLELGRKRPMVHWGDVAKQLKSVGVII